MQDHGRFSSGAQAHGGLTGDLAVFTLNGADQEARKYWQFLPPNQGIEWSMAKAYQSGPEARRRMTTGCLTINIQMTGK